MKEKVTMRFFERKTVEVNSSSMADIAFLLLIFFLVTTTIQTHKGLNVTLPPYQEDDTKVPLHDRNLYKVHINSKDHILIEDAPFVGFARLHEDVKRFILNNGKDPELSVNPQKAVISLQMNRGTHYGRFIEVMDALQGVYYEIYGDRVGLTAQEFRNLKLKNEKTIYDRGRDGIPMNISIAEPYHTH